MPAKKAEGTKYLIECYMLGKKDYRTLFEHFKPEPFTRGLRRILYRYMREHNLPVADPDVESHFPTNK
jgi:hypothetical protein